MYPPKQIFKKTCQKKTSTKNCQVKTTKKRVSSCVQLFSKAPANPKEGMATLVNTCEWANKEWIWTVKRKETTRLKDSENMYTSHKILTCLSLKNGGYKYIFAITCSYVIASSRWRLPSFLAN